MWAFMESMFILLSLLRSRRAPERMLMAKSLWFLTIPMVVSLKSLRGAHCRGDKTKQKMTRKPSCSVTTPQEQSAGRKKAAKLPSSNKHLGNHSSAKKEQKGGQKCSHVTKVARPPTW